MRKTMRGKPVIVIRTGEPGLGMTYLGFIIGKRGWQRDEENKKEGLPNPKGC